MKTKHAFIAAHASEHAIRFMCRVLGVAHSWFHARRRAAPKRAERAARREELLSKVDGAVKSRFLMRVGWIIIVHVYFTRPTDRRIV